MLSKTDKPAQHSEGLWSRFRRYVSGEDIFISYSRIDGLQYATALANALSKRYACRIDAYETQPGEQIPKHLRRALSKCSMMVLIGSRSAAGSDNVRLEVAEFAGTRRNIVVVAFENTPEDALWSKHIVGLPLNHETLACLTSGRPSDNVIELIGNSVTFKSRNRRIQRVFWSTAAGIGAILLAGAFVLASLIQSANRADEERIAAQKQTAAQRELNQAYITAGELQLRRSSQGHNSVNDAVLALRTSRILDKHDRDADAYDVLMQTTKYMPRLQQSIHQPGGTAGALLQLKGKEAIAIAETNGDIHLWNLATAEVEQSLSSPGAVQKLQSSVDKRHLLKLSENNQLVLWNMDKPREEPCNFGETAAWDFAFNPQKTRLALGSKYRNIDILRLGCMPGDNRKVSFPSKGHIDDIGFIYGAAATGLPRQRLAINYSLDDEGYNQLYYYDAETGEPDRGFAAQCGARNRIFGFDPSGRYVASGCDIGSISSTRTTECNVRICRPSSTKPPLSLSHQRRTRLLFSPDGNLLATNENRVIRIWATSDGRQVSEFRAPGAVNGMLFSDDTRFLTLTIGKELHTIETVTGERTSLLQLDRSSSLIGLTTASAYPVTRSPDGHAHIWTQQPLHRLSQFSYEGTAIELAFSAGGRYLRTRGTYSIGSDNSSIRIWSLNPYRLLLEYSSSDDFDASRRLRQRRAHEVPATLQAALDRHFTTSESYAVLADGNLVIVYDDEDVTGYLDASRLKPVGWQTGKRQYGSSKGPVSTRDDKFFTRSEENIIEIVARDNNQTIAKFTLTDSPKSMMFSPDQRFLAVASGGQVQLWLWRLDELRNEVCNLLAHNAQVEPWKSILEGSSDFRTECPET